MIYKYIHTLSIWFKEKFNYDPKIQKAHWLIRQKDYIKNKKRDDKINAALSLNPYGINNTKGGISNGKKE
tara:strand:- start:379 stop:588 length:210 start_codon:yes stop_codon:yes gene_type:complete